VNISGEGFDSGMYFDAHNHFQDEWLRPHREILLRELPSLGIGGMVVNGTCVADWAEVEALGREVPWLIPSFGLHPWDCGNREEGWLEALRARLLACPRAQVGEIGIDRWILDRAKPDDPRLAGLRRAPLDEQLQVFHAQMDLACELGRTPSIHCIDAWGQLLDSLRARPLPTRGFLLHSYAGSAEMVPEFVKLGACFSFNGSFLEERKNKVRAAYRVMPQDRILVETDAPAMPPPPPWRPHSLPDVGTNTVNHPGNLVAAYKGLAQLRGATIEQLEAQCSSNFRRLFCAQA
jgi:TatD DNase family protein